MIFLASRIHAFKNLGPVSDKYIQQAKQRTAKRPLGQDQSKKQHNMKTICKTFFFQKFNLKKCICTIKMLAKKDWKGLSLYRPAILHAI